MARQRPAEQRQRRREYARVYYHRKGKQARRIAREEMSAAQAALWLLDQLRLHWLTPEDPTDGQPTDF